MSTTPEDRIRAQWRAWWRRTGQYREEVCYCCGELTGKIYENIPTPGEKTLEMARQWGKSCAEIKAIVKARKVRS